MCINGKSENIICKYMLNLQNIIMFLVFLLFVNSKVYSQVEVSRVALNIGKSVTVNVASDLKIEGDVEFINNGVLDVFSKSDIELLFDVNENKENIGKLFLTGNGHVTFLSNNLKTELINLVVACNQLNIEANLCVLNEFDFRKGIIDVYSGYVLSMSNPKSGSLIYSKAIDKYIKGYFTRKVNPDELYVFPMGGDSGLSYMEFDNLSSENNITVGYLPFDDGIISANPGFAKAVDGIWDISSENNDLTYDLKVDLENLLNYEDDSRYRLVRIGNTSSKDVNIIKSEITYPFVGTDKAKTNYRYLLVKDVSFRIVNMVVANGKGGGMFKLPDVSGIEWGELSVMDSQGKLIFHSPKYANDFCVNSLTEGTYFYYLHYTQSGEMYVIKNFIEVVYEK